VDNKREHAAYLHIYASPTAEAARLEVRARSDVETVDLGLLPVYVVHAPAREEGDHEWLGDLDAALRAQVDVVEAVDDLDRRLAVVSLLEAAAHTQANISSICESVSGDELD
jgi:hypothetical protein